MRDFPTVQEYLDAKYKEYTYWNMQPQNHNRPVQDFFSDKPVTLQEVKKQIPAKLGSWKYANLPRDTSARRAAPLLQLREPTRPTLPSKAQLFDSAETSRAAMRNR